MVDPEQCIAPIAEKRGDERPVRNIRKTVQSANWGVSIYVNVVEKNT